MATRSPSPNPSSAFNTHTKTPDSSSGARKNGGVTVSKPLSSSCENSATKTDFSQRNSGSKVGIATSPSLRASFEQKENERDTHCSKPARARSPARGSSKGGKSFMAPTISAASKAVSASPRKKILGERNEVISVSDSLEFHASDEIAPKLEKVSLEGMERDEMGLKSELGIGLQDGFDSMELRKSDVVLENCPSVVRSFSPSPVIAPLDADPSLAPYDPKTNYLSPRPRFLHYRPNPRIEQYLRDEDFLEVGDGKRLEDSFSSESLEEVMEEEQSSDPQMSSEEESSCFEVEIEEAKEDTFVPTPETKPNLRPNCFRTRFFSTSKLVTLLLVFVIACLSIPLSDTPLNESSTLPRASYFTMIDTLGLQIIDNLHVRQYLTGIAAVVNGNLELLANREIDVPYKSPIDAITYLTYVASVSKQEEVGLFHLANITNSAVDQTIDLRYSETKPEELSSLIETTGKLVVEENEEEEVEESSKEQELDREIDVEHPGGSKGIDPEYEAGKFQMEADDVQELYIEVDAVETIGSEDVKEANSPVSYQIEEVEEDMMAEEKLEDIFIVSDAEKLDEGVHKEIDITGSLATDSDIVENHQDDGDFVSFAEIQQEAAGFRESRPESTEDVQSSSDLDLQSVGYGAEDAKLSTTNILVISTAVVALAATFVLFYVKQKKFSAARDVALLSKLGTSRLLSGSGENVLPAERTPLQKFALDSELVGNSGPSEMSSSLHSSSSFGSRRTKRAEEDETLGHERRMRRDSAASSSISYGSFTTYEKLSGKKGGGRDEEVVTPVRRSSRIRNQITSP